MYPPSKAITRSKKGLGGDGSLSTLEMFEITKLDLQESNPLTRGIYGIPVCNFIQMKATQELRRAVKYSCSCLFL